MCIDDAEHTLDLIAIAVKDGGKILLRMVEDEPRSLAEVRALARGLEVQPALCKPLLWEVGVGELVLLVVGVEQVLDDCAGLEKCLGQR